METPRIRVLLLCGGQSTEHEISLESCKSVAAAIDHERFQPLVAGITREGVWNYYGEGSFVEEADDPTKIHLIPDAPMCYPGRSTKGAVLYVDGKDEVVPFDVAFPVLHGMHGEDGTIQGLFEMFGVPYVGCDYTSSANCMDKDITKILLNSAGFRTAYSLVIHRGESLSEAYVEERLGMPLFVKPARTGSSVGISKVKNAEGLTGALEEAFKYDDKVLLEECIVGREIECGVLELPDKQLFVAQPGEVVPHDEFYSYAAKYLSSEGATVIPCADLAEEDAEEVKRLAAKAFHVLGCSGMARIDFFLSNQGDWVLNEVNTIPGFTSISLYPQMMKNSGIPYPELITNLIENALSRHSGTKFLLK
ncbi:MAG: D-alanine--D-alanine ligase [Victivallales bacterium]|nr:D-alanine--D-alanine ligase [Victivallales bacterium]